MDYEIKVSIPNEIKTGWKFLFIGIESKRGNLLCRKDITDTVDDIDLAFSSEEHPKKIIFWEHGEDGWGKRIIKNIDLQQQAVSKKISIEKNVKDCITLEEFNEKVTIVFVDEHREKEINFLINTLKKDGVKNILHLNSKKVNIKPIYNIKKYCDFLLKDLFNYVETEYCLVSQWDGYVLNIDNFKKEFFNYDYIGSRWLHLQDKISGNGGFSLRSKKFLKISKEIFNNTDDTNPEDEKIEERIQEFLDKGIKFAPDEIKDQFSIENGIYNNQFGFHNYLTNNLPDWTRNIYKNKFYHSGDIGDVIYSLPVIKHLGGGCLILSPDYKGMPIRDPMTYNKAMQLKELFSDLDFIVKVDYAPSKPIDIDYDLNESRQGFIDWGAGKLSHEEIVQCAQKPLIQNYENAFNIEEDTNIYPFLECKKKIVYTDYPIIINRTERYQNKNFPWAEILKDFRDKIGFVGLENEYNSFVEEFGYVKKIHTESYLILLQTIAGCKLFIGNQSFPYSLAEGIKQNCIQETDLGVPNCMYRRYNSFIPEEREIYEYKDIKKFIYRYLG